MQKAIACLFFFVLLGLLVGKGKGQGQTWDCTYAVNGYLYDLTPENTNSEDTDGLYTSSDGQHDFYWRMCQGTNDAPDSTGDNCDEFTFVCQTGALDYSCGQGPPAGTPLENSPDGQGISLTAIKGSDGGCDNGAKRKTVIHVHCATDDNPDGTVGEVIETDECDYTISMYLDAGCGTLDVPTPSPSPSPFPSPSPSPFDASPSPLPSPTPSPPPSPTPSPPPSPTPSSTPSPSPTPMPEEGLGGFVIFLIIFICLLVAYFVIGSLVNFFMFGKTGAAVLPLPLVCTRYCGASGGDESMALNTGGTNYAEI